MVVQNNQNLTLSAIEKLKSFAEDGLPIIVSGGRPGYFALGRNPDAETFEAKLSGLLQLPNVYSVARGQISKKLFSLGLEPRVTYSREAGQGYLYSAWRDAGADQYLFLYADGKPWPGNITVRAHTAPQLLDP